MGLEVPVSTWDTSLVTAEDVTLGWYRGRQGLSRLLFLQEGDHLERWQIWGHNLGGSSKTHSLSGRGINLLTPTGLKSQPCHLMCDFEPPALPFSASFPLQSECDKIYLTGGWEELMG